jgi:adenylate cyclase class 2
VPANYIENEIKVRYPAGAAAALRMLEQHGYKIVEPRALESDQLFDRDGELRNSDRLLRLRRAGGRALITYKGPAQRERHKSREEVEFEVTDADAFATVLDRLSYYSVFRYEKYRTKLAAADEPGFITIDETPMGTFLELEGPADWIDRTAGRLGFTHDDYLTSSYASLYREYRNANPDAPADMMFSK